MLMEGEGKAGPQTDLGSEGHMEKKASMISLKSINNLEDGELSPLSKLIMDRNTQRQAMLKEKHFKRKVKAIKKMTEAEVADQIIRRNKIHKRRSQFRRQNLVSNIDEILPAKNLIDEIEEEEEEERLRNPVQYVEVDGKKTKVEKEESDLSSLIDSSEASEQEAVNPVRQFGPAAQKFREIVQRHFLSRSLKELEAMDYN